MTADPRLDRRQEFDQRSRNFPVRALLESSKPKGTRSYTWRCLDWLDQGREGACVGFAWAHELAARPAEVPDLKNSHAFAIYKEAQKLDQWEGENYDGTSVIAGIKAVQKRHPGKIQEYRWAFGLKDVLETLSWVGPVVLGVDWFEGMYRPDGDNIIKVSGQTVGGHAILANGINPDRKLVRLHNSWGKTWGKNGECYISFSDLEKLLHMGGEACVALKRGTEKRRKIHYATTLD